MNNQEILALYETVSDITEQMLVAASNRDWEQFTALEADCSSQVKRLQQSEDPRQLLSPKERSDKVRLIKKILVDDRKIRDITEPWMAKLALMMKSVGAEKKLAHMYGANQAR
tara:strand:- start:203642 stop:203980 length:339 start_codon:yes stop_codon:yes gene_type:complete